MSKCRWSAADIAQQQSVPTRRRPSVASADALSAALRKSNSQRFQQVGIADTRHPHGLSFDGCPVIIIRCAGTKVSAFSSKSILTKKYRVRFGYRPPSSPFGYQDPDLSISSLLAVKCSGFDPVERCQKLQLLKRFLQLANSSLRRQPTVARKSRLRLNVAITLPVSLLIDRVRLRRRP